MQSWKTNVYNIIKKNYLNMSFKTFNFKRINQ